MSSTTTFSTTSHLPIFQPFLDQHFHPRKLLLSTSALSPPPPPPPSNNFLDPMEVNIIGKTNLDRNVILLLVVLFCALISSLGLNSVIQCALRYSVPNPSALIPKKAGVNKKALKTFPVLTYSPEIKSLPGLDTECVICLSEFAVNERVRILPKCSHGFHVECIDKWLGSHSSCPTCRNSLKETCKKIASSSGQLEIVQECVVVIAPLEREDLTRDYR